MTRILFSGLALFDAVLLAYFASIYDWFVFEVPSNMPTPAAIIIIGILWAILIAEKILFTTYFLTIGSAIVREIMGKRDAKRWLAVVATLAILPMLAGTAFAWIHMAQSVVNGPLGFIIDRLTLFDGLAAKARGYGGLFGTADFFSGSIGNTLVLLLGMLYLSEKYLLAWWRVRWPVPLLPLLAVGWLAWSVYDGEERLRAYVAAQQWRPVAAEQTWLAALDACGPLGAGWRLPRREELARYLSTEPAAVSDWKSAAWTASALDGEGRAIAVDLKPRKSGRWNKGSELTRDESLCELRTQPGYANDWVADLRPYVCEHTTLSAYLYTPGIKITALQTGNIAVTQPTGAVICMRPADDAARIGVRQRRGYKDEQEFARSADFRAYMTQKCSAQPDHDRAACFAYGPDLPAFEESGDERMMHAFCELDRNGEGCHRYALLMDKRPDAAKRAARYRDLACQRGYKPDCAAPAAGLRPETALSPRN